MIEISNVNFQYGTADIGALHNINLPASYCAENLAVARLRLQDF